MKRILKILDPKFIKGIAFGICICVILGLMTSTNSVIYVFFFLIAIIILILIGALIGNYYFNYQKNKLEKNLEENYSDFNSVIEHDVSSILELTKKENYKEELLPTISKLKISHSLSRFSKFAIALITRYMAFGTLITTLGGLISFAVFMATYMQVKHLEKQNSLIDIQNNLAESSRRAGLIFELSSILEEIDEELDIFEKNIYESQYKNTNSLLRFITNELKDEFGEIDIASYHTYPDLIALSQELNYVLSYDDEGFNITIKPKLSDRLEGRIAGLSQAFRPYRYLTDNQDKLSEYLSPERSQLLISLIQSNVFLGRIIANGNFSSSDLKGLNISKNTSIGNFYSSFIDLELINLAKCKLDSSSFYYLSLASGNLDGANIYKCDFDISYFQNTLIRNANLKETKFKSCNISDASFANSILEDVKFKNSDLNYTFFDNTTFSDVEIIDCILPQFYHLEDVNIKGTKNKIINSYTAKKYWLDSLIIKNKIILDSTIVDTVLSKSFKRLTKENILYQLKSHDTIYRINTTLK